MRLRSTLPATAVALLAVTIAAPAQALAADAQPVPPAAALQHGADHGPDRPFGPATPLGSGVRGHDAVTPATAPVVVSAATVKTAAGLVIEATLGSTDPGQQVSAVVDAADGSGSAVTVDGFTQTAPGSAVWQSPVLQLPAYGQYTAQVTPADSTGAGQAYGVTVAYVLTPVVHATITPDTVDYDHQNVVATGRLTAYDPGKGDTGQPFTDVSNLTMVLQGPAYRQSAVVAPDGSFTVSLGGMRSIVPSGVYEVYAQDYLGNTTDPVTAAVGLGPLNPTRIVLDQTSGSAVAQRQFTVSGTIEYQDGSGTWRPLPGAPYMVGGPGYSNGWNEIYQPTDVNGRFTTTVYAPTKPDSFEVDTNQSDYRWSGFLAATPPATFTFTSITAVPTLVLGGYSIDEYSTLSFDAIAQSTNGHFPDNRIYVLESPDGRSHWKNLGYIQQNGNTAGELVKAWVDNPHGYWKLWSPAAPGYVEAYSNVIHTFRYLTSITGAKPDTTSTYRGRTLHFSGGLWEQGMGNWFRMGANWRVYLFFKPSGSKTWKLVSYTRSDRNGYWNLYGKATGSGTWEAAWFTGDTNHVDAFGPASYVHVR